MTATTAAPAAAPPARPVSVARALRFELVKQLAQWRVRLLVLACLMGPAIAVIVVSGQSTLPADTLFGREMHAMGWAGALVVLSFAGSWVFPLLTSVVAGDVFSCEDRLGTWRHLLVAVRSPRRIFLAKALASLAVLALCVPGLAASGIVGGLVVGSRPLTGLDGHQMGPMDAAGKLLLAWLCVLAPVLAFAAIGLLASVIFGRSPVGLLLPAFGGLGMQLASQVLPMPAAVRVTLPSFAFLSWNGLFTSPPQLGSLIVGVAASLAWAAAATAAAAGISTRYLHMLFEAEQHTVSAYIRGLRLDRARRDLLDPRLARRPVSATAYACGFRDLSGFNRAFKAAYAVSPRELRDGPASG